MAAHTTRPPGVPTPVETVTLSIPMLAGESLAVDLSNAVTPISGVARVEADVQKRTLTVEYDTDFLSVDSLRKMITKAGYPIGERQADARP